ncbi:MAG: phosphopantetheine-binding protein [Catenulispora sp.]|nr:phosphopantetheine-binding protein [Catenulispora sp.]
MTENRNVAAVDGESAELAALRRCILAVVPAVPPEHIHPDRSLAQLGCNSIDRAEILVMAAGELAVATPVDGIHEDSDLDSLAALLRESR